MGGGGIVRAWGVGGSIVSIWGVGGSRVCMGSRCIGVWGVPGVGGV